MAQPVPTRRALIGGAGIAAVAVAIPAVASIATANGSSLFATRLAEWKKAHSRFLHAANVTLVGDAVVDDLCHKANAAYRGLLFTPAPDATAMLHKLAAMHEWCNDSVAEQDEVEALTADAVRLLQTHGEA